MKRYRALKYFIDALNEEDLILVAGSDLCKEAYEHDDDRFMYLKDDFGTDLSIAVGLSSSTKRRVYFLCEDYYLINNLNTAVQAAVSRNENLYIIVFISGYYQFADMPDLYDSIKRPKSVLFDFGFTTHDYSKSYKIAAEAKTTAKKLAVSRGPLSVFIKVDVGSKDLNEVKLSTKDNIDRFSRFIRSLEEK